MIFDAHCHINEESFSAEDRQALIDSLDANPAMAGVVDAGYDLPSSWRAVENSARSSRIYAAVGIHPHAAVTFREEDLEVLARLAEDKRVVALGEIGLDYHYETTDKPAQHRCFRAQIRLANRLRMPVVIHARDAGEDTLRILREEGAFSEERTSFFPARPGPDGQAWPDARVYMHCFSGSRELGMEYVRAGATLGIAGPVTYKNNRKTVQLVAHIPLECLLAETDSPYLSPGPLRGKPNRPWFCTHTIRKIAEIKDISYQEAESQTCRNALRFYKLEPGRPA